MTAEHRKQQLAEATKALDMVQAEMYTFLKPLGFKKHGRLFHRFVDGDVSQVVELQRGQAYREETHLFWICVGIRIPECQLRSFLPEEKPKKYYHEYECNLRWTVGEQSKKKNGSYNLRKPIAPIIEDVLNRLNASVLPMFDALNSREAIIGQRMKYPQLWPNHPLFDHAMIQGRRGHIHQAIKLLLSYGCEIEDEGFRQRYPDAVLEPQRCLERLAARFNIIV